MTGLYTSYFQRLIERQKVEKERYLQEKVGKVKMRGRRMPTAQAIAEGDPRRKGVHKLDAKLAAEPKAERGLPDCPKRLQGLAREAWGFWSEELEKMGLDHRPDGPMLEGACRQYARAVAADLLIEAEGIILEEPVTALRSVRTPEGIVREKEVVGVTRVVNPAVGVSDKCWGKVLQFCSQFGLSPVSRTRLTIEKKDDGEKELLALLSKPRAAKDAVQ